MSNHGLLYQREYFRELAFENFEPVFEIPYSKEKGILRKLLTRKILQENINAIPTLEFGATKLHSFELKTTYPGLLCGAGYAHKIDKSKNELRLGLAFDHTSGLPYIPGSSIKGVLRNVFEARDGDFIQEIGEELFGAEFQLDNLKPHLIFEYKDHYASSYRCIFYDSFPIGPIGTNLFGTDYIAAHSDPLKSPIPIQFLKVLPGVSYKFSFELKIDLQEIYKEQLLKIFQEIIELFGLGAKTNVGYGQFEKKT